MNADEYAERLLQETIAAADADPDGAMRAEVFTRLVAERLTIAGELTDADVAYHRARGVEVSGWSMDEDDAVLHLLVTDYRGEAPAPSLTNTAISQSFHRLEEFYHRCLAGYGERLEESTPVFELADLIAREGRGLKRLKLYLFSDARARAPRVADSVTDGTAVSHHVWDLERLRRLDASGTEHEPISIDVVARLGHALKCVAGPQEEDHRVFLLLLPGTLLADLYDEFGARLLERNVRAFLQARGAVNRGLRETLKSEPERFLAYNNGVSATASSVQLVKTTAGGCGIAGIDDLQIVNGGQTTASIHSGLIRDRVDLRRVHVQAKLTVVSSENIDAIVPSIAQFSNTQNKVTGADFSSSHPYHVKLEEIARTIWAPAADGSQRQIHWFYERARGQYADELARSGTPARQRQFKLMNPPPQKVTKTDVAKFENSWQELPHIVSLGAEKNFREFMLRIGQRRGFIPDTEYFMRLIAKAILFRSTVRIVVARRFGGYTANIVTYTIAKLVHATGGRLDLDRIWRAQRISEASVKAINDLSCLGHDVLMDPPGRISNVGEWSKKLECWRRMEESEWTVPRALERELI